MSIILDIELPNILDNKYGIVLPLVALNHLIVRVQQVNAAKTSFVNSFEFPILDAGDEDQSETLFAATPLTLRT